VTGTGTFTQGTVQPITATAASGWNFVNWTGDSIADPFASATTITINGAKVATANFAINTYSLSYSAGPNGSITGNPAQTIDHGSDGTAVTAVPATGYSFVNWSDGGTANPRTDANLTATLSVTANFEFTDPDANANGILDEWENIKFGNAAPGANPPDEDPDRDGLSNLLEYAFDTHPLLPNVSPVEHDLVPMAGGKHLRLSVAKNPEATNLAYSVEVSGDLADPSWTSAGTTIEADTLTELRVRDDTRTTSSSRRFIRLKVTAE
jgi:hypothetical protein